MMEILLLAGLGGVFFAILRRLLPKKPAAPRPPEVGPRRFDVFVAFSVQDWEASGHAGLAAVYCPPDGTHSPNVPSVAFNADAWPSWCKGEGAYSLEDVLESARHQDVVEGRPPNRLIEDFILHEVAGHHFLMVGADHNSGNTLMNERNGPKTEKDRDELRAVLKLNVDGFQVHAGYPRTA